MAKLKFKFEILISGIYPFNGNFERLGFELITKKIDEDKTTNILNDELIYISPLLGMCCYPDAEGSNIYLTFDKEEYREIVEYEDFEDKKKIVDQYLSSIDIFEDANKLEKIMILNTNNNIKFPIKMVKVYDENEKLITITGSFMKLNIPCLIGSDQEYFANVISRQNNRLSSNVSYEKISELMANNKNFNTAMSLYYSSFSITDISVSFTLLNSSLDSLLSWSTYGKPRKRKGHNQSTQGIKESIAENANALLMCVDGSIKEKIRNYYKYRSKFVHAGIPVKKEHMQDLQEYVRKILLMYWYVALHLNTFNHKTIIKEIKSKDFCTNTDYQYFMIFLDNTNFEYKRDEIMKTFYTFLNSLIKK